MFFKKKKNDPFGFDDSIKKTGKALGFTNKEIKEKINKNHHVDIYSEEKINVGIGMISHEELAHAGVLSSSRYNVDKLQEHVIAALLHCGVYYVLMSLNYANSNSTIKKKLLDATNNMYMSPKQDEYMTTFNKITNQIEENYSFKGLSLSATIDITYNEIANSLNKGTANFKCIYIHLINKCLKYVTKYLGNIYIERCVEVSDYNGVYASDDNITCNCWANKGTFLSCINEGAWINDKIKSVSDCKLSCPVKILRRGKDCLYANKYAEAKKHFLAALAYDDTIYDALDGIGFALLLEENTQEAIKYLEKAYTIAPGTYAMNTMNLIKLYIEVGEYNKAFECFIQHDKKHRPQFRPDITESTICNCMDTLYNNEGILTEDQKISVKEILEKRRKNHTVGCL